MANKVFFHDTDFIELIARGDEKALSVFYKLHYPMVLNLVLNNNGTVSEARDIYQEAIIVFYNKVRSGQFELQSKLKTYIYSVCRRLWLNRLKEKKRFVTEIEDFEDYIPVEEKEEKTFLEEERKYRLIQASIDSLGEPCKTVIEDFYMNSCSIGDLVTKLGYTNADTAKNIKYKCLQRLKKIFFTYMKRDN